MAARVRRQAPAHARFFRHHSTGTERLALDPAELAPWQWHTAGEAFGDTPENSRLVYLMFFESA